MPSVRLLQESIGALTKVSSFGVSLAPSKVTVGGQQYTTSTLTCYTATIGYGGLEASVQAWKMYYVYVVVFSGTPYLLASTSSSGPSGFTAYKLVGYFDTDGGPLINGAANSLQGSLGDIKSAHMTEAQFVAKNGPGWILADGRNVNGSTWASVQSLSGASAVVPDARGMILRGSNNGGSAAGTRADGNQDPGGVRALGNFQNDSMQGHYHNKYETAHGHTATVSDPGHGHTTTYTYERYDTAGASNLTGGDGQSSGSNLVNSNTTGIGVSISGATSNVSITSPSDDGISGSVRTSTETRMRNIAVNHFIRVN